MSINSKPDAMNNDWTPPSIESLPKDVYQELLLFLGLKDQQALVTTTKDMKNIFIEQITQKESLLVDNFVRLVCHHLDECFLAENLYQTQTEKLRALMSDRKILDAVNLISVKSNIKERKTKILNLLIELEVKDLKKLQEKDLKDLENLPIHQKDLYFFKNVFHLAELYKKFEEVKANQTSHKLIRDSSFRDISKALLKIGDMDKAIEVANIIDNKNTQGYVLQSISKTALKNGQVDIAIKIANTINDKSVQKYTFQELVEILLERKEFEQATKVTNVIADKSLQQQMSELIYQSVLQTGDVEIVKKLLQNEHVDPSAHNNYAIQWASENGHIKIVEELLKDKRVDPSVNTNYAIRLAKQNGHEDIVKLLAADIRVDASAK